MTASAIRADGEGGLPKIVIRAADGAAAEVYLHGAHVTSWRPSAAQDERLFLSARSRFQRDAAIRGGVPVIFPQFAAEGPLPRHGFARTTTWLFTGFTEEANGHVLASFALSDDDTTRAVWPHSFRATLVVRVGGNQLQLTLSVENTGSVGFRFTAAVHTYLRVADVRETKIVGLHGASYRTSDAPTTLKFDGDDTVRIAGEIDRVYVNAPRRVTVREPARETTILLDEFPDIVVWNPGPERAAALKDMEPNGERRMLCVEAAAAQSPVLLDAGHRWSGSQTLIA